MDNLTVVLITFENFYNFFTDITLKGEFKLNFIFKMKNFLFFKYNLY